MFLNVKMYIVIIIISKLFCWYLKSKMSVNLVIDIFYILREVRRCLKMLKDMFFKVDLSNIFLKIKIWIFLGIKNEKKRNCYSFIFDCFINFDVI